VDSSMPPNIAPSRADSLRGSERCSGRIPAGGGADTAIGSIAAYQRSP
jgi:hypothetical protein